MSLLHHEIVALLRRLTDDVLFASAERLPMNAAQFRDCMESTARQRIDADIEEARRLWADATPTFFIGTSDGRGAVQLVRKIVGNQSLSVIAAGLAAAGG